MSGSDAGGLLPPQRRPRLPGGRSQLVTQVLDRVLDEDPGRLALVGRHGRLSYSELDAAANRAACALASLGVGPGDRVAVCLPNDVDIVIAFLGSLRVGAIWVGVNRPLAAPEKLYLLRDSGARVYLQSADLCVGGEDGLGVARRALTALEHVVRVDPEDPGCDWSLLLRDADGSSRPPAGADLDPFAPAAIAYTSGTTGFPKGAVHSHHNLLLPGAVSVALGDPESAVRQAAVLPLTILNLMVLAPLTAFQAGSACVAIDRVDPLGIAEWVQRERVGHFAAVPTIFHDLLTHPDVQRRDLASLVRPMVGGSECPEELRTLYRERFGAEVAIGYGMTEAPTAVTRSSGAAGSGPGLCGRALPQIEIQICDDAGEPLPRGELGEICVGPSRDGEWAGVYTPMLGYWNQPEATARALRGGVYHTGDLGLLEPDGTLYIRGRRSELILRGGANVYPGEVERVLGAHPAVLAAAVLGCPDARLGERVVAVVELAPGAQVTSDELLAHCLEQLARYKTPEEIRVVADLPRNAMGKILKRKLEPLFAV